MIRCCVGIAVFFAVQVCHAVEPVRKPNVIVFLVDDMGWMDCGAYGSKYYETPHIDRFAARGMSFTNAYAQPLCSPTRASLLTGKSPARHGITTPSGHLPPQPVGHLFFPSKGSLNQPTLVPESRNFLEPTEITLAETLKEAGYRTGHLGKWHLGTTEPYWPEQQGFDIAFHCHPDPGPPGNYFSPYNVRREGEARGQAKVGTITDGPAGEYIVDRLADEAVRFIETNRDRPFFLNLWNYGVHGPWGHKEAYTKAFAGKTDPRGEQGNPIMASMLRSVDECFGRIVDSLDRNGLTENTIVVFNSDNGGNTHSNTGESAKDQKKGDTPQMIDWRKWAGSKPPTNNAPLRDGKGSLYEGGTRVPLMWVWPGRIKPGMTSDAVVGHIDLYPTLLELLDVPKPRQQVMDGLSYAPVLRQTGSLNRKAFFNYFPHGPSPGKAGGVWARSGDWKLIRWFGLLDDDAHRFELYNLREDIGESKNLAPEQPARVMELDSLIDAFLKKTGATYPRPNPDYKPSASATEKPSTPKVAAVVDPLEGWKARQCEAVVKGGVLTISSTAKAGTAFLGHGTGTLTGPAKLSFRIRMATTGAGKVEWLPNGAADTTGVQSVPFEVTSGEWQTQVVELPAKGPLGIIRLYLPAHDKPVEIDWIELTAKETKPQRWGF